jgi:ribosome-binding factor A
MRLRRTPEIAFLEDTSLERGDRILHLLNDLHLPEEVQASEIQEAETASS